MAISGSGGSERADRVPHGADPQSVPPDKCPICLAPLIINEVGNQVRSLLCSHKFHAKCIGAWERIKAECPLCRKVFQATNSQLHRAAEAGNVADLRQFLAYGEPSHNMRRNMIALAARNGHTDCLPVLLAGAAKELFLLALEWAAEGGSQECVQWILTNCDISSEETIPAERRARFHGHVECANVLINHRLSSPPCVIL